MDTQSAQMQKELEEIFLGIIKKKNLTEDQAKDMFEKLEGAIMMNLTGRLLEMLSDEDGEEMERSDIKNPEELFDFLSGIIAKESFQKLAGEAAGEVLSNFFEKLDRGEVT